MVMAAMRKLARGARLARLRALVSNFSRSKRGNVAVITALAMLPMVAAVGCVIDYTSASMVKTKLQAAADAATLAAVSLNSTVIATAKAMSGTGTVSGGSTFVTNFFNANLTSAPETTGYNSLTPTATVTLSGTTVTAALSFTAELPTYFMGIMGVHNIALTGTSTATYTLPTYIDFYLMLDVSGSMSFPSTAARAGTAGGRQSRQLQPISKRLHLRVSFHRVRGVSAIGAARQYSADEPGELCEYI